MGNIIEDWKQKKNNSLKHNKKFVRKLSQHKGKRLDKFADELHEEAFSKINCLDCANCCSSIPPIVNKTDISRISKHLGMKVSEFETTYLTVDEDGDTVINQSPCPFLQENNECLIYEARPRACREYPHTDGQQFSKRMQLHSINATYCPAVFYILEEMKKRVPV